MQDAVDITARVDIGRSVSSPIRERNPLQRLRKRHEMTAWADAAPKLKSTIYAKVGQPDRDPRASVREGERRDAPIWRPPGLCRHVWDVALVVSPEVKADGRTCRQSGDSGGYGGRQRERIHRVEHRHPSRLPASPDAVGVPKRMSEAIPEARVLSVCHSGELSLATGSEKLLMYRRFARRGRQGSNLRP